MYPERRPYATTVGHGGYLSKPLLPPVEALRILNSPIGIDVPRSIRLDTQTAVTPGDLVRRTPSRPCTGGRRSSARGVPMFKPATLESASPFSFKDKDYHNSQQAALNAQLNNVVEELFKVWRRKVRDLQNYLNVYPMQSATSSTMTADAMMNYFQGYRSIDVLPVSMEQLVKEFKLASTPEMLGDIQNSPALSTEHIRRTLNALLSAKHFLAPLEHYVQELEALAFLALRDEPCKEVGGVQRGPVWLSKAAVALHEKFHYNPSEYALKELRKSDEPLGRLERRVMEAKEQKERAIDEELPGEALSCLTSQVDLCNDLLLANKARLELVRLHSDDVRDMKPLIDTIIADARRSVELLKGRIERDLPLVKKDLESLRNDTQNTEDHIQYLTKVDSDANKEARKEFRKLEDDERDLWELLMQTMQKLVNISDEKKDFVQRQLRLREQRAYDMGLALELLKTQQQYYELLRSCDDTLWRWSSAAEVYETYVEAYVPKLLKKLHDAEEADQILYNREAQEYVRRYEMFEYAVEEGRATRQVHADRLKVLQRSKKLDVERAMETLDPHLDKYNKELRESQAQLEETEAYINLVRSLQRERRSEVEPILQHVILHNRTVRTQQPELEGPAETLLLRDKPQARGVAQTEPTFPEETHVILTSTVPAPACGADGGPVVAATDLAVVSGFSTASPLMATVAHPHVQARTIGINHEEAFLEKYRRFTDDEQCAVEAADGKVRKARHELDKLGLKYDNMDYVKMQLGTTERRHTAPLDDGSCHNVSGELRA
ncbi:hypothetical protein TRSC58_05175 [Trypanosoma rangeli SC58]|uniref:Paraflagellar rod protein n=1 Tax=Trypanosoma rangeli SC58 TaxID=429131 RepID=A0A061J1K2_TRYRA|nr:hypothetical protein TRSC58_05175 [Trypanosoma rangeli SC58]